LTLRRGDLSPFEVPSNADAQGLTQELPCSPSKRTTNA
jgi:hypothetical protein